MESKEDISSISELITLISKSQKLIQYLKKLEDDNIRLEDLIDVIDDTSEETDALIQELMEIRNAFNHLKVDKMQSLEKGGNMFNSLLRRMAAFKNYTRQKDRLHNTINRCIVNLDSISIKISGFADKAAKTLVIMESF